MLGMSGREIIPLAESNFVSLSFAQKTRTQNLADTIFNAWPFLIFILAAAGASGMTVWLLVRVKIRIVEQKSTTLITST